MFGQQISSVLAQLSQNIIGPFSILLFISLACKNVNANFPMQCYKCTSIKQQLHSNNDTVVRLCSKFEETSHFVVTCQFSTMCMKRVYQYEFGGEIITLEDRDCADQKYEFLNLNDSKWEKQTKVEEAYKEGCTKTADQVRSSKMEYCYCRDHLCNSAEKNQPTLSYSTDTLAVILIVNVLKYLQSL